MTWSDIYRIDRPIVVPFALILALLVLTLLVPVAMPFDMAITHLVQLLPPHLDSTMNGIATVATYPFLIAAAAVWAAVELLLRNWQRAAIALASLSAQLLFYAVKELTHRARPVSEFVSSHGLHDYSFPSGHSAGAAGVYGIIALLAADRLPAPFNRIVIASIIVLIVIIGIGRIYLEAHYPTDVLAGWLVGLITIAILRPLIQRYPKTKGQN